MKELTVQQLQIIKGELLSLTHNTTARVEFLKADGSKRVMDCSNTITDVADYYASYNDTDGIARHQSWYNDRAFIPNLFTCIDVEIMDFRSFNIDKIKKINGVAFSTFLKRLNIIS